VSLGLVHAVLSDRKGASYLFFVGCYRDNEVAPDHIIHGFRNWLSSFNVPYNTVHLGGMAKEDVLSLVSDSLRMLPRLCQSLAEVVHRKTDGNPLFVQTFLRSLGEFEYSGARNTSTSSQTNSLPL
jgi:predicted ATPase